MNLQDDTIQLLVDLVEKEQRRLDQFQPDSQDYARRFHALMDRFADDQPLRKELLGLADLHGLINCRHKHFFFQAGVQLGLALGSIAVLQDRKYVRVEKLRFIPEDRGRIVTVFLENFFKKYVEYDFTAQLEEYLDDISNGEMEWKKLLGGFWTKFIKNIDAVQPLQISEVIEKIDEVLSYHLFPPREDGSDPRICPECGKGRLSIKLGKFGAFLGCSNYPECKYTKPLTDVTEEMSSDTPKAPNPEDKTMGELNGLKVYLKKGPYGFYIQLGEDATATTEKPKRVALPRNLKPEDVTPEQALILASLPRQLGNGIEANIGKFGQYLKQGNKSKSLTGNDNIFNITLERAEEILKNVAERPAGKILGQNPKDKADITVLSGRYGPYIKCGKNNYAIPREFKDRELTLEDALKIIAAKK